MDSTWISLEWDAPRNDGGSRVIGYLLEYKEPNSATWLKASQYTIKDNKFTIESLHDKGTYEFRGRIYLFSYSTNSHFAATAKNVAGWSKPGPSSGPITLKPKYGPPGPPTMPIAESIGRNYVTLTWVPPSSDGGSKLVGYIIERRSTDDAQWIKCNNYNVNMTEFTIPNLIEYRDYEFRVCAINGVGRGPFSPPTSPIKVQEMGGNRPEIVRPPADTSTPLNKVVTFECEAIGKPMPHCRW
jgi:hypothetical protein